MRRKTSFENEYFEVTEPFNVEVRVGLAESNTFIGSSMALETVYQTVRVEPGDELHLLVGGDFLIRGGKAYEFYTRRSSAWEVMLHPAPFDPPLPLDKMAPVEKSRKAYVKSYRYPALPETLGERIAVPLR